MDRTQPARRTYWLNLLRFLIFCVLMGTIGATIYLYNLSRNVAHTVMSPARLPLEISPADLGITTYEDVSFTTEDGITLRGWYIPSENGATVLMGHGHANNRTQLLVEAAALAEQGYGVLLFDWRGHGESDDALVTLGDHEQRDFAAALAYVQSRADVEPERIGALGFSMGGTTVTLGTAGYEAIQAVVIEAAYADLDTLLRYRSKLLGPISQLAAFSVFREQGVDFDRVQPAQAICRIAPRPVLLIYGDQDTYIPPGSADALLAGACDPVELWMIAGAGHGEYWAAAPEEYPARLLAFFDEHLAP